MYNFTQYQHNLTYFDFKYEHILCVIGQRSYYNSLRGTAHARFCFKKEG